MKINNIIQTYDKYINAFKKFAEPIFALALRVYIFNDMFRSGWLKFLDLINGAWSNQVYLFANEFKVPIINPSVAAFLSMINEVGIASLLLVGLFTRFSALALLGMAIVIELTYIHHLQHIVWITMLTYLLIYGGGHISVDKLLRKKLT